MSSERAGAPTHGALNREKAREVIAAYRGAPTRMDGEYLDALEACVVPDHRITRIETEVYGTEKPQNLEAALHMIERVRAALRPTSE